MYYIPVKTVGLLKISNIPKTIRLFGYNIHSVFSVYDLILICFDQSDKHYLYQSIGFLEVPMFLSLLKRISRFK